VIRTIAARLGRDGVAGAFVVACGVLLWFIVRNDPRGELADIGPGFVPWVSSFALMILGAIMVVRALSVPQYDEAPVIGRGVVTVPIAMAVFAYGLEPLGLFTASALGVFITSLAARESTYRGRIILALSLGAAVTLVFGYGLGMTMPLWPEFMRP
jgi:hypothetical protein